jgi:hypothetical protein
MGDKENVFYHSWLDTGHCCEAFRHYLRSQLLGWVAGREGEWEAAVTRTIYFFYNQTSLLLQ